MILTSYICMRHGGMKGSSCISLLGNANNLLQVEIVEIGVYEHFILAFNFHADHQVLGSLVWTSGRSVLKYGIHSVLSQFTKSFVRTSAHDVFFALLCSFTSSVDSKYILVARRQMVYQFQQQAPLTDCTRPKSNPVIGCASLKQAELWNVKQPLHGQLPS